jgi:hypothetical protein
MYVHDESTEHGKEMTWVRSHRRTRSGILALVAALAMAACSTPGSPHVARLGKSKGNGGGSTTTTLSGNNPTQLLDEWASCMRAHGDPNQADPTIDADKVIDITWDPAIPGGYDGTYKGGQGNVGPGQYCRQYLNAAQAGLGGDQSGPSYSQSQEIKFAECMRANGVANFPDPMAGRFAFQLGGSSPLSPNNPTFQNASKVCTRQTGVQLPGIGGSPSPGTIELNGATPFGGGGT